MAGQGLKLMTIEARLLIWARGYKKFFVLNSTEHKFILLVGILTFISMINTTSERLKAKNFFICRYLFFISSKNFVLS